MAYTKLRRILPFQQCAALYVRVSTKYQVDKDSLPFQKKKLKEYLKFLGIKNFVIFEDDGYSAKNTDRPQYQKMMSGIRRGEFSHLIVWKVDRISRNLLDFASMYDELKRNKVTFISLNEQFDTSTAIGEAMLKIILIFAELERQMTAERVMGIMLDRAESGLWNGGHIPFGYKLTDDVTFPIPDDEETKIIHSIFDKYEETKSCIQVSRWLNNHGIKGKRGGEWTSKLIHDIIRNPFYIGTYRYNVRESARGQLKPEEEWVVRTDNHIGIIEKEQFIRCNRVMDENASTRNTAEYRDTEHVHTFSGLLRCAACGSGMQAAKDRPRANGFRPSVYRCSRRVRMLDCESKTISEIILGPFVLNYIANMSRIQKNFKNIVSPEKMKSELLKGVEFKDVISIEEEGLNATYNALLYRTVQSGSYQPGINRFESDTDLSAVDELKLLKAEQAKTEKAIERLLDLYLYDPESMTKEQMSSKQNTLKTKLSEITERITEIESESSIERASDISFIKKASAFLVSQKIVSKKHIDYVELALTIDNAILKDFFQQIIDYIEIDEGRIVAICFANGLTHRFKYKEKLGIKCKLCGGHMGSTVGCRTRTLSYKGKTYPRIKVGDPGDLYENMESAVCHDCGAHYGRWHHYGCDVEICPICGEQYISCIHGPSEGK